MSSFIINSNINTSAKSYIYFNKSIVGHERLEKTSGVMPKSSRTTDFEFSLLGVWNVDGIVIVLKKLA
jgi:hypothetical protein